MWNPLDGLATVGVVIKLLTPEAQWPLYATEEAAGADLFSIEKAILEPGQRALIRTGISIELPKGFEAQIRPRSGWAAKFGISIVNSPGTVDSDYRGEIKVNLINHGDCIFKVDPGLRIAQMVIVPVFRANFVAHAELTETARGEGGFGSTGS